MFSDPISLTLSGTTYQLPRIEQAQQRNRYATADELLQAILQHQKQNNGRIRSTATFVQRAIVPDPLTTENDYQEMSIQVAFNRPIAGFTLSQVTGLWTCASTFLTTANVTKLYGQEA